jgi:hypothetical protein
MENTYFGRRLNLRKNENISRLEIVPTIGTNIMLLEAVYPHKGLKHIASGG